MWIIVNFAQIVYFTKNVWRNTFMLCSESKTGESSKRRQGVKNAKMAAKVSLMKMKMKSLGDPGCPEAERVYFQVYPPLECQKPEQPLYFSKVTNLIKNLTMPWVFARHKPWGFAGLKTLVFLYVTRPCNLTRLKTLGFFMSQDHGFLYCRIIAFFKT